MEFAFRRLVTGAIVILPTVALSIGIFLAFWIAAAIVSAGLRRVAARARLDPDLENLVVRVVKGGILVFGTVTALGTIGVNVSALVAGLGLTGFALGFALKDILGNLLAGALILMYRPFRRDDHIAVAGFEGVVTEVDLRYTTLRHENQWILIPNSTLFTNPITVTERPR
jgi:small conductance mechanosensitive channel